MLVPAGIVTGLGDSVETAAAVLAAGTAEAVIVAGFAAGEVVAAGAWDAVDAVWVGLETGITGAAGGCGAPTDEEGGATLGAATE